MTFIEALEQRAASDSRVRAVLKRSRSAPLGTDIDTWAYVEPWVQGTSPWRREAHYLVAALWAANRPADVNLQRQTKVRFGVALGRYQRAKDSDSVERRFTALLKADRDQLNSYLPPLAGLLKDYAVDYDNLLTSLIYWDAETRRSQLDLARDYYRTFAPENV